MATTNNSNSGSDIKIPELDPQAANQLLNNVLAVCDKAPNVIPIDTISSVSYIKTTSFRIGRLISIFMLIFLLFLPFFFIAPVLTLSQSSLENNNNAIYIVSVDSLFPINHISATLNGEVVPVVSMKGGEFSISFAQNGIATITATALNHQSQSTTFNIASIDTNSPSLVYSYRNGDFIYIVVNDADSGIDFENIVAYTSINTAVSPHSYDEETGTIVFQNITQPLNLSVPDKKGNVLHVILTPIE